MDIKSLTSLVIEKFDDARGYSELSEDELYNSIFNYLNDIYNRYYDIAKIKIKEAEALGLPPTKKQYQRHLDNVEDMVMIYANKLAATEKNDL